MRGLELQAGQPQKKGNRRGPAYAYNVKELREQEMAIARESLAEATYERSSRNGGPESLEGGARERLKPARLSRGCLARFPANALLFATRSPAQEKE